MRCVYITVVSAGRFANLLMFTQRRCINERLEADLTVEHFCASMVVHMSNIVSLLGKLPAAEFTGESLLPGVVGDVVLQTSPLHQHLPTDMTFELLLRSVDLC